MPYTDLPTRARESRDSGRSSASSASKHSDATLASGQYTPSPHDNSSQVPYPPDLCALPYTEPERPVYLAAGKPEGDSSSAGLEAGNIRQRGPRRRIDSSSDEHTFFSSIRDNDDDNNWDDLNEVDLRDYGETSDGKFDDMLYEQVVDPDDPAVTGAHKQWQEDYEDVERQMIREMSYKQRRKQLSRIKIEYNISCMLILFVHALTIWLITDQIQPSSIAKNSY